MAYRTGNNMENLLPDIRPDTVSRKEMVLPPLLELPIPLLELPIPLPADADSAFGWKCTWFPELLLPV